VKKVFKISGTVFTAVLYSIAVFLFTQYAPLPGTPGNKTLSTKNSIHLEAVPADFFGVPLTQESGINLFSGVKYSGSDFQYKAFSACLKSAERTISSAFIQYVFQAKNFPVKLRKADLLFPFHYFW
jgi:hypothetical protein